jgi:hypothetical protein
LPSLLKPAREHLFRFLTRYTTDHCHSVVCTDMSSQVDRASHGSPLGVSRGKDHLSNSRLNQGTGAHGTGFQGHQQSAVIETPVTTQAAGLLNCHQLSVPKRIIVQLPLIDAMANAAA